MLAQVPSVPDPVWQKAAESGFFAILVVLLLVGWAWERWKLIVKVVEAMDRVTRAVTLLVLSMSFLPKPFKDQAEALEREVHDAERSRDK